MISRLTALAATFAILATASLTYAAGLHTGTPAAAAKHTVRVLIKGKPAEGAHVVMKNTNGSVAATCDTNESGECQVQLGPDRYAVAATGNGRTGAVTLDVSDASGPIVIKLKKAKTESGAPRP